MATRVLINDINNDWNNTSNWSGATVPISDDTVILAEGDHVITTNVTRAADTDDLTIYVEREFEGQLGTAGTPLTLGTSNGGSNVIYNGPACKGFHISGDIAAAYVLATHPQAESFSIEGGTCTLFIIHGGVGAQLAAAGTFTTVIVDGTTADLEIETGNTVTTHRVLNGTSRCSTTATNTYVGNGTVYLLGASKTYALLELYSPTSLVYPECSGGTITLITAYAGIVDARKAPAQQITVTNATAYAQAKLLYGAHVVESNVPVIYGGAEYQGYGAPDYKTPKGGIVL